VKEGCSNFAQQTQREAVHSISAANHTQAEAASCAASAASSLQLDLDVHARREIQLHQGINGLVGRVDDVHQALVRADFQLIATRLIDVRRTQDIETLQACRQGHRPLDDGARALGGIDDLGSRLVDEFVVKRLQANTDFLLGWI